MPVYSEPDSVIEIQAGHKFSVQLPSNIGTGYRWELKEQLDPAVLSLISREHLDGDSKEDNAGGLDQFLFQTQKTGTTQLSFWFVRPWVKDKSEDPNTKEKSFSVTIK